MNEPGYRTLQRAAGDDDRVPIERLNGKAHYVALNAHNELASYPIGAVPEVKGSADVRVVDKNIAAPASEMLARFIDRAQAIESPEIIRPAPGNFRNHPEESKP
ncbi:hypothetical protein FJU30_09465 [Affinibrenneria salicis]|uniref:Uncharacterized protein n=1 Tax=Affinibrenneria salicis TaxID=2590031 RepID=A0A5J5G1E7_9GAMM|nr:DUF3363 domain-containing protein [Affinibrenneria salicis]KAA9000468.1 hypothetical protein FJU30_09465 [Affinibrenneria salicis]